MELTGLQKAAIIIASLKEDVASEVLKHLTPNEVTAIVDEIAKLDSIPMETIDAVTREFSGVLEASAILGGKTKAEFLMEHVLGGSLGMAKRFADRENTETLKILQDADPIALLENIKGDQPRIIAIVLRFLPPVKSARILRELSPEVQKEVIKRMTTLDDVPHELIEGIAKTLKPKLKLATSRDEIRRSSGIGVASTIVSYIGGKEAREILQGVEKMSPDAAERMRQLIFTFDDLANLDDRSIQRIIREVDKKDIVIAFKAANDKIKDKILSNMSDRAREELMEEFETIGPVRLAEVEDAQRRIVEVVRRLDESGEITIARSEERFV